MKALTSTPQKLATLTGAAILAASTNANILQTGGYFTSHAALVATLALGVFAGARVVGAGAGKIGVFIIVALLAGEMFNFVATGERVVTERESSAAPLMAAKAKRDSAVQRLHDLESGAISSARLTIAKQAKAAADKAVDAEARDGGCKRICQLKQAEALAASSELKAAIDEAQKLHAEAIEAAREDVATSPLPPSATPLADRLGIPAWLLDLIIAGLLSFGSNILAGTLIAFGSHSTVKPDLTVAEVDAGQTDFSVSEFEAAKLRAMVAGEFPEPTPPKPRKRRKVDQFPENVISFQKHPVVTALKSNGGSVSSNQELADLMRVSKGEASKRWQEIESQLVVTREGKQLRIALKA